MSEPRPASVDSKHVLCVLPDGAWQALRPVWTARAPGIVFEHDASPDSALARIGQLNPVLVIVGMIVEEMEGLEFLASAMSRYKDFKGKIVILPGEEDPFPPVAHFRDPVSGRSVTEELETNGVFDLIVGLVPAIPISPAAPVAPAPARAPGKILPSPVRSLEPKRPAAEPTPAVAATSANPAPATASRVAPRALAMPEPAPLRTASSAVAKVAAPATSEKKPSTPLAPSAPNPEPVVEPTPPQAVPFSEAHRASPSLPVLEVTTVEPAAVALATSPDDVPMAARLPSDSSTRFSASPPVRPPASPAVQSVQLAATVAMPELIESALVALPPAGTLPESESNLPYATALEPRVAPPLVRAPGRSMRRQPMLAVLGVGGLVCLAGIAIAVRHCAGGEASNAAASAHPAVVVPRSANAAPSAAKPSPSPAEPAATTAAAATAPGVTPEQLHSLTSLPLSFARGRADYEILNAPQLDDIVSAVQQALQTKPGARVELGGHTSAEGSAKVNGALGRLRALVVERYLVDHAIAKNRIQIANYASSMPLDGDTRAEKNRRVTLRIIE